jgi:hypothetical protein
MIGGEDPQEFDADSAGEGARDLTARQPDRHRSAGRQIDRNGQGGARYRNIDDPGHEFPPVRQDQGSVRNLGGYGDSAFY